MSDKAFKKAVELAKVFKVPFKKMNKKSNAAKVSSTLLSVPDNAHN